MQPLSDSTIDEVLRRWSASDPAGHCLSCDDRTLTWRALQERSNRLAQGLLESGVRPGERVAFLGKNAPEFYEVLFGAAMVGAATTGINWRLTTTEAARVLEHSEARMLFVGAEMAPVLPELTAQVARKITLVVIGTPEAAEVRIDHQPYESWLASQTAQDPKVPVGPLNDVLQVYTSGTTGEPKAVVLSHRALMATSTIADVTGMSRSSVVLVAMPLFHSAGSSWGLDAMMVGAHTVIARDASASTILGLIDRWNITQSTFVPAVLKALVESADLPAYDLSSLQTILYAAAPISPVLLRACLAHFACDMVQVYGSTETQGATCLGAADHVSTEHPERLLSAGEPLPGVNLRIADPATGAELKDGEIGEVWVRSATNMTGYWRLPDKTHEVITDEGYVRTGDLGSVVDGYLYLHDRMNDRIISGGENVYPGELEAVLLKHPGILDVAVIGVPSERWGETVHAVVVRNPQSADLDEAEVIRFARGHLAPFKAPTSVQFVDELPRSEAGKVLKRVLRGPHWEGHSRRIG